MAATLTISVGALGSGAFPSISVSMPVSVSQSGASFRDVVQWVFAPSSSSLLV
jgi:hypothetical protein